MYIKYNYNLKKYVHWPSVFGKNNEILIDMTI